MSHQRHQARSSSIGRGLLLVLWFLTLPAIAAVCYHLFLPGRVTALGHFLVGYGVALLALRVLAALAEGNPAALGVGALTGFFLAVLAESAAFPLVGPDPVHLCSQLLGGLLAALLLVQTAAGDPELDPPEPLPVPVRNLRGLFVVLLAATSLAAGIGFAVG